MRYTTGSLSIWILTIITVLATLFPLSAEAFRSRLSSGYRSGSGSSSSSPSRGRRGSRTRTSSSASSQPDGLTAIQDTYIDERRTTSRYGTNSTLRLKDRNLQNRAGLVKFDLSGIPGGSSVTSAKLFVYVSSKSRTANRLSVFAALGEWNESTSWSTRPSVASSQEDTASIPRVRQYYELDVRDLVQDWVNGVETNDGVYLLASGGDVYVSSKENRSSPPVLQVEYRARTNTPPAAPTPTPTPTPTPAPTAAPTTPNNDPPSGGSIDSGYSDAPIEAVNKRIVVVAKNGSGNYNTIQAALNNSRPGDTIQVKDGVYNERVNFAISGTSSEPIVLVNYPGAKPVIDPGGGSYPSDGGLRVEFNAEWIIIEGFEIRHGWDGVKVYKPHNTIRDNWIHHNKYMGILVVSTNDVFIEGNSIEYNGTDPTGCWDTTTGRESPKHCHAVYISDYNCTGPSDITIRGNVLSNHGGRGVQWNGSGCSNKMSNNLVENNIIENNSWGMVLWHNVENSVIRNNTFVLEQYPSTDDSNHTHIGVRNSVGNIFKNNIFYSTRSDVAAVQILDSDSGQNTFDYNLWKQNSNTWIWNGGWRSDFSSNYKSVTGWGGSSLYNANPGFYNVSGGIYHLTENSSARNSGQNSSCAPTDFDKEIRSDSACDIGMDEFFN